MYRKIKLYFFMGLGFTVLYFFTLWFLNYRFVHFCDQIFSEELSQNTLTLHYTVKDPQKYKIDTSNISLGSYTTDISSRKFWLEDTLGSLSRYPRFLLTSENAVTYDLLKYTLDTELEGVSYLFYEEPLTPSIGVPSQLPVLLAEFTFEEEQDVEIYLALLADFQNYMDSIILFEEEKKKQNLFMDLESAQEMITFCQEFCQSLDSHFLQETFLTRLKSLSLSPEKEQEYEQRSRALLENVVFPAYRSLENFLTASLSNCGPALGLAAFPEGSKYYQWLIKSRIGSDLSLQEIEQYLDQVMTQETAVMKNILAKNPGLLEQKLQGLIDISDISQLITQLCEKSQEDFPSIPSVTVTVSHVPNSMADYLSPAFYLTPAVDDYEDHRVYLNDTQLSHPINFFTTLAHESYPGHLYQTVYENAQGHHPVRKLCYFGGFVEGWATYAELQSYHMASLDPDLAALLAANQSITLNIYSHLDLYVHGYGWNETTCKAYLKTYGMTGETAHRIFQLVKQQPANYLKYYLGYLEICKLKEQWQTALGQDFVLKDFHKFLLDYGPAPFPLLRKYSKEQLWEG